MGKIKRKSRKQKGYKPRKQKGYGRQIVRKRRKPRKKTRKRKPLKQTGGITTGLDLSWVHDLV